MNVKFHLNACKRAENVAIKYYFQTSFGRHLGNRKSSRLKTPANFFFLIEKLMNVKFHPDAYTRVENVAVNYDIQISFGSHLGSLIEWKSPV